jgi:hypothetical protein
MRDGDSKQGPAGAMKDRQDLLVRIVLLAFFVLAINTWADFHFGQGWLKRLAANGPLALIGIVGFFRPILRKDETGAFGAELRQWFLLFLRTPVLVVLYGLLLVGGSFISSVTVMSSGAGEQMDVRLSQEGRAQARGASGVLHGADDVVRLMRFTTPFGRAFYLDVDGYLRYSFDLYPWVGKKVRVSSDLAIAPSVLIRVPFGQQSHLDKGAVVVKLDGEVIAEMTTRQGQGSVIVGPCPRVPNEFTERWRTELLAEGVEGRPFYACLLGWQYPGLARPSVPLAPGMVLEAEFFIDPNDPIARAEFGVGSERIKDILLLKEK